MLVTNKLWDADGNFTIEFRRGAVRPIAAAMHIPEIERIARAETRPTRARQITDASTPGRLIGAQPSHLVAAEPASLPPEPDRVDRFNMANAP